MIASFPAPSSLNVSLRRISHAVSWLLGAGLLLAFGGATSFLIDPHHVGMFFGIRAGDIPSGAALEGVRLRLFLALLPGLLLFAYAAFHIRELFRRFARGVVLDADNGKRLTLIGWLTIAGGALATLDRTMIGLALTASNPPGQRLLVISLSMSDFIIMLFGLLILAFGHVVTEAARLADENRGFV